MPVWRKIINLFLFKFIIYYFIIEWIVCVLFLHLFYLRYKLLEWCIFLFIDKWINILCCNTISFFVFKVIRWSYLLAYRFVFVVCVFNLIIWLLRLIRTDIKLHDGCIIFHINITLLRFTTSDFNLVAII